ncbi:MAG: hypothetical protein ACOYKN_19005 [Pirellula sp.]
MPLAAEIPKKKKPNYFDNYSGFADFRALTVQAGGINFSRHASEVSLSIGKDSFPRLVFLREFSDVSV